MNKEEVIERIEKGLDIALIVMQNGGSTVMAERTFRNVLKDIKQNIVWVTWRLDFVVVNIVWEDKSESIMRPIGVIGVNLARTAEAAALGEKIENGFVSIEDIDPEIKRIKSITPSYNFWVMLSAASLAAAFYSKMLNGDTGSLAIAFFAACAGQLLRSRLQKMQFKVASVTFICGVLSACIAAAGLRFELTQQVQATMIASIIYLVPGLPLINGFMDVISNKHLFVGLERIFKASLLFLLLVVAIAIALTVFKN